LYPFVTSFSIETVQTLSNGRTYGFALDSGGIYHQIELPASGPMRLVGTQNPSRCSGADKNPPPGCYNPDYGSYTMQSDGSFIWMDSTTTPGMIFVNQATFAGFDGAGNPLVNPFVNIVAMNFNSSTETFPSYSSWGMFAISYQPTTAGVFAAYYVTPTGVAGYPHLSGIVAGRSSYLFHTNREGALVVPDFKGTWPSTNSFGGHNGVASQTIGNNIFTTFDGQYASYGNTNFHYWTDGLMVGQFNQMSPWSSGSLRYPGAAGNIAQTRFVSYNGDIYMYMTVEAGFTPLQRWRISNLNSIVEVVGSGTLGSALSLH
jgi:hypothetical protein